MEEKHKEIMEQLKPLKEAVAGVSFVSKAAAFITVVSAAAVIVASWLHR